MQSNVETLSAWWRRRVCSPRRPSRSRRKHTVAYIAPSLDISYWQWVAYGAKTKAKELGMDYIEMDSHNSPADQMNNVRTAITRGVDAIVMGPVSSTSTPPVLRVLKQKNIPIAFTGIGPQPGQTDYTSSVTANNYETGKAEGKFICEQAKKRGGNKIGMLSLPQDRENAQKYLKGAKEAFKADGCDLVQILQTKGLTVREAVNQANDLLTAHPDIKGIYGMYDEAATGAAKVLQTRHLVGKIAVATADGSPTTVRLLKEGVIQGLFLQEAVGQGIEATQQVYNALNDKKVTKDMPLSEPLVTAEDVGTPKSQEKLKRVYPPRRRLLLSSSRLRPLMAGAAFSLSRDQDTRTMALLPVIDAHHHLYDLEENRYPWLQDGVKPSAFGDYTAICKSYRIEDFLEDCRNQNVVKSVHLDVGYDPADPVGETRWLQGVADKHGFPHGIVGYADFSAPDVADILDQHMEYANFRGIRQSLNYHPDPAKTYLPRPGVSREPDWRRGFKHLVDRNLSFDLQIYYPQMEESYELAKAFPGHADHPQSHRNAGRWS